MRCLLISCPVSRAWEVFDLSLLSKLLVYPHTRDKTEIGFVRICSHV